MVQDQGLKLRRCKILTVEQLSKDPLSSSSTKHPISPYSNISLSAVLLLTYPFLSIFYCGSMSNTHYTTSTPLHWFAHLPMFSDMRSDWKFSSPELKTTFCAIFFSVDIELLSSCKKKKKDDGYILGEVQFDKDNKLDVAKSQITIVLYCIILFILHFQEI